MNSWEEYKYGKDGIRTGTGSPDNQRGLKDYRERQQNERSNWDSFKPTTSTSSTGWGHTSNSSSSGEGFSILLALATLFGFFAAADYMTPYTGSHESALIVTGALFALGMLCLWLLWRLMVRLLAGIVDVLEVVWDNKIGRFCISAAMIAAGFWGAKELYGDRGIVLFGELLLGGVVIWGVYAGVKWFCSTLVGKILLRTTAVGGLIVMAWYLYARHNP